MRAVFFSRRLRDGEAVGRARVRTSAFLWASIPLGLFVAFFWASFSPDARFAYRDVAYYYYPLFQQIQGVWERGEVPLWDPYANLGQPLLADPTASVFYPIKLLFFFSSFNWLSYSTCFKLYIWLHVALAFASSFVLARRLRVSRVGSLLSGVAYAFSGQTLFQYSNVVYLVGSAWAPAFFVFLVDYFRAANFRLKTRAIFKSSVVYALCVLGGEPQIAYVCLASSAFILLFAPRCRRNRFKIKSSQETPVEKTPVEKTEDEKAEVGKTTSKKYVRVGSAAFYCATTALFAFLLAAIQILPSAELVGRSERSRDKLIRSIWDVPKAAFQGNAKDARDELPVGEAFRRGALCLDFSEGGRSCSIYRFSVGAQRWSEFLFPNVGGRQFPQSSRWFEAMPEELAVWTPTLYCGVLPFLLALCAARLRLKRDGTVSVLDLARNYCRVVATWGVVFGTLAALGGFGVVWHIRAAQALLNGASVNSTYCDGDPVGGLYWLLNLTIPKFAEFRYPAKTLTISVLGVAILAGIGWDRERNSRRFRVVAVSIFTVALLLYLATICRGASFFRSFTLCNPLYGSFQPQLAEKFAARSFLQTALVLAGSLIFLFFARRLRNLRVKNVLLFAALTTTAFDIYFANSWIVEVAPTKIFGLRSEIARQIEEERATTADELAPPTRVYRYPVWFPPFFQEESSSRRIEERVLWDVATLYPKYPFRRGVAIIDARGATMESAYCAYVDRLIARTNADEELAFLGVERVVGPRLWVERVLPDSAVDPSSNVDQSVASKRVRVKPTHAALFRDGKRVEEDGARDYVETLEYAPNRIVYLVRASESSDVVLAEQYWPDWRAKSYALTRAEADAFRAISRKREEIRSAITRRAKDSTRAPNVAPVEKVFEFLRKIDVPQGDYCVVVEYRPRAFFVGAVVSSLAWIAASVAFIFFARYRRTSISGV